jgi:hypothetical protein
MSRIVVAFAALLVGSVLCLEAANVRAQDGPIIPGLDSLPSTESQPATAAPPDNRSAPGSPAVRPQRFLPPARPATPPQDADPAASPGGTRSLRPDPFEDPSTSRTAPAPKQSYGLTRPAASKSTQGQQPNRPADPRMRQWQQQQQLQQQLQQRANLGRQGDPRYNRPQSDVPTTRTGNPPTSRQSPQGMQRPTNDPRRYQSPNSSAKKKTSFFGR